MDTRKNMGTRICRVQRRPSPASLYILIMLSFGATVPSVFTPNQIQVVFSLLSSVYVPDYISQLEL